MGRKRTPRAATDVVQWLARVREVSGRRPRRTLILTLWADNDAAKQAMREAVPLRREGSADGDLYAEATEEFGVVTFRGRIEAGGGVLVVSFKIDGRERLIVTDVTAR